MMVKNISTWEKGERKDNDGYLDVTKIDSETIKVLHSNNDDGHYYYEYVVRGTVEEIAVIEQFCKLLTGAK
jgi:hypothetical protein